MATRRAVLASLAAATALPGSAWALAGDPAYLAAARLADGGHALHGLTASGTPLFAIPLPARGHAAAAHPTRAEAVAFARRPGSYALVIDCLAGAVTHRLAPPPGRQFNGHGAFSADGALLYTSEVVAETSAGRIGVWDAQAYRRIAEWPSGGIGPHDLKRLGDGVLVVANGGIRTDPTDRTKLNLDTMRPNLSYLGPDGAVREQVELAAELAQNSIRHLAPLPDGRVAFAMQWEGDPAEPVPLLGLHRPGGAVTLCPPAEADAFAMRGYAGSIACTASGDRIAITSPRGGVVQIHGGDGAPLGCLRRADACGVARAGAGFLLTDGNGALSRIDGPDLVPLGALPLAWDNHLVALG